MKKKFDIKLEGRVEEDISYYIETFKKEAMAKASEIFGEALEDMPPTEFDIKDIYKTNDAKTEKVSQKVSQKDTSLSDMLARLQQESSALSHDIFKDKQDE
jgi:hypothetical protein